MKSSILFLSCCLLSVDACTSRTDKPAARTDAIPAEQFVDRFYDWYSPLARESGNGPAWNVVLNDSAALLSAELVAALRADSASQAAAKGEIAGIDFDPFLNSQDPCESYHAGMASRSGDAELVEVYAECAGTKSALPDAVMELEPNGATWVIRNVRYPNIRSDLLSVLRSQHPSATPGGSGDS